MAIKSKTTTSRHKASQFYPGERLLTALEEIPQDSRGRLAWVIKLVDSDWNALRREPAKLAMIIHGLIALLGFAPVDGLPSRTRKPFATAILEIWERMLHAAAKRQGLYVAEGETRLVYWSLKDKFVEVTLYDHTWETAGARALAKFIVEHGHLIKQCPAPRLRAKG
jgi:hypothetical protein